MSIEVFVKDPSAKLDYQVDWSAWLGTDTISESSWTVPAPLTNEADAVNGANTIATVWITGGMHGTDYTVTNQITTDGGRINQRSFKLMVREQ